MLLVCWVQHTDAVTRALLQHAGCPNPTLGAIFSTLAACTFMFRTRFQSTQTVWSLVGK